MGSCCKPSSSAAQKPSLPPSPAEPAPLLYFFSAPYLFTYNPLHRIAWKEELSVDGVIDSHYRACLLDSDRMMVVSAGGTFIVYTKLCSAVRKCPVTPGELWKGDLIAYCGAAYAVNACVKRFSPDEDTWEKVLDLGCALARYISACLSSSRLLLVGASPDCSGVSLFPCSLPDFSPEAVVRLRISTEQSLSCHPLSPTEILFISDTEEAVYDNALQRFSKTTATYMIDRSPSVMQVYWRQSVYVVKESGSLTETRHGVWFETRIPEKDVEKGSLIDRCPAATLLERDESVRHRPGLYTYAGNFEETEFFCMQLNTLSMVVREVPAGDEPLIAKNAGWCMLPSGDLLLAGGTDALGEATSEVMEWNIIARVRSSTTPLPAAQSFVVLCAVDKSAFALGATVVSSPSNPHVIPSRSHFQRFETEARSWEVLPPPPHPVLLPGFSEFRGFLYAIGGCTVTSQSLLSHDLIVRYSLAGKEWTQLSVRYPEDAAMVFTLQFRDSLLCFCGLSLATQTGTASTYLFTGEHFERRADSEFRTDKSLPVFGYGPNCEFVYVLETSGAWSMYDPHKDIWRREEELMIATVA